MGVFLLVSYFSLKFNIFIFKCRFRPSRNEYHAIFKQLESQLKLANKKINELTKKVI